MQTKLERGRHVDRLVDPLWLYPELRLGPIFPPRQPIRFHPNLDGPVHLDARFELHRNVSPLAHIDATPNQLITQTTWHVGGLTRDQSPTGRPRLADNVAFAG